MDRLKFNEQILSNKSLNNIPYKKYLFGKEEIEIYPKSIREKESVVFFIARDHKKKYLYLYCDNSANKISYNFEGINLVPANGDNYFTKKCHLNTFNRKALQNIFPFTNAVTIGLDNSFGFGDRLGLANPAHITISIKF